MTVQQQTIALPKEKLREMQAEFARRHMALGNAMPAVAFLWPHLLITDPDEAKWFDGKIGDVTDPCLRLDRFQRTIINGAFDAPGEGEQWIKDIFIKGCAKPGKGAAVGITINLWWWFHPLCKIVLASVSAEHAISTMFAEVVAWRHRQAEPPPKSEEQTAALKTDSPDKFLRVGNTKSGEGMSGAHGPATLYVFDEASATGDDYYKLAITQARVIIALSNPRVTSGFFRNGFPNDDPDTTKVVTTATGRRRLLVTVGGLDTVNVRAEREIIPSQITKEIYLENKNDPREWWGRCFADGKFPKEDPELQLILPSWLKRHHEAWDAAHPKDVDGNRLSSMRITAFGLDVAASDDGDSTVLCCGGPDGVDVLIERKGADTMETVQWVVNMIRSRYQIDLTRGTHVMVVDATGAGKGAHDRLRQMGCKVIPFLGRVKKKGNVLRSKNRKAKSAVDYDRVMYANQRAAAWGELSRRLNPDDYCKEVPFCLPEELKLTEELIAHERVYTANGSFKVTPKAIPGRNYNGQTIKEKIGRSPDRADAVVYFHDALLASKRTRTPRLDRPIIAESMEALTPKDASTLAKRFNSQSALSAWTEDPVERALRLMDEDEKKEWW